MGLPRPDRLTRKIAASMFGECHFRSAIDCLGWTYGILRPSGIADTHELATKYSFLRAAVLRVAPELAMDVNPVQTFEETHGRDAIKQLMFDCQI